MQTRAPNTLEANWLDWVGQLPCIVCLDFHGVPDTPAEIHHIDGRSKDNAHLHTIPLCSNHHRHADTHHPKRWISRHGDGRHQFEQRYTTESDLLAKVFREVVKLKRNHVGHRSYENN